jgi:hypothetical protein
MISLGSMLWSLLAFLCKITPLTEYGLRSLIEEAAGVILH